MGILFDDHLCSVNNCQESRLKCRWSLVFAAGSFLWSLPCQSFSLNFLFTYSCSFFLLQFLSLLPMLPRSCPFYRLISRVSAVVRVVKGPEQWGDLVVPAAWGCSTQPYWGNSLVPTLQCLYLGLHKGKTAQLFFSISWVHWSWQWEWCIPQDSGVNQVASQVPFEPCLSW